MSGYASRDHECSEKLHDLWCKALVLQDAVGKRCLLVTLDLIGIDRETSERVLSGIHRATGLRRDAVMLSCSHTHSGPVVGTNLMAMFGFDQPARDKIARYTDWLVEQIIATARKAASKLEVVDVQYGIGKCTVGVNRRNNIEAKVPEFAAANKLLGPVDHDVPVLHVFGAGNPLDVIIFGYACHNTVLDGYQWCGDYAGYAQLHVDWVRGRTQGMFVAGCGADQNPLPRRRIELAQQYGHALADEALRLCSSRLMDLSPTIHTARKHIPLRFHRVPTERELKEIAERGSTYPKRWAKALIEQKAKTGRLPDTYSYPVQYWQIGELKWVALGGEVTVDYSLRLKQEFSKDLWVSAYCNDVMAYIPSRRVWDEGGYEGEGAMTYYGLPSKWAGDVEERIVRAVRELVGNA